MIIEMRIFITIMAIITFIAACTDYFSQTDKSGWSWKCAIWIIMTISFLWE